MDYKTAGVDIEAGYKSVELMKKHVKETMRPEVLGGLGGFSGAFSMEMIKEMDNPVLLSGTDGVGTKIKLAFLMDKHDTVGIDCVAMCINDVVCAGGEPLFFLDYIACGKNYPEKIATIVKGVAEGCKQARHAAADDHNVCVNVTSVFHSDYCRFFYNQRRLLSGICITHFFLVILIPIYNERRRLSRLKLPFTCDKIQV